LFIRTSGLNFDCGGKRRVSTNVSGLTEAVVAAGRAAASERSSSIASSCAIPSLECTVCSSHPHNDPNELAAAAALSSVLFVVVTLRSSVHPSLPHPFALSQLAPSPSRPLVLELCCGHMFAVHPRRVYSTGLCDAMRCATERRAMSQGGKAAVLP
jgi:hypothetical protein